jgi:hypothetical protein
MTKPQLKMEQMIGRVIWGVPVTLTVAEAAWQLQRDCAAEGVELTDEEALQTTCASLMEHSQG